MRAVILVFVCLLASSTWAQSPNTQKPVPPVSSEAQGTSKSKNNPSQEKSASSNIPTSINLNVTGKLQIESENSNEKADPESNKWLDPLSILTGLLVVVTGFLAKYTYYLWQTTSNLAIDARNTSIAQATDMKTSLSIAQRSADAATAAVATTERNARKELRAYVGVSRILIVEKKPLGLEVSIANTGKTGARKVKVKIGGLFGINKSPDFESGEVHGTIVVMPNEICGFLQDVECQGGDTEAFKTIGLGTVHIWGSIEYLDVFDIPHRTIFRFTDGERVSNGWLTKYAQEGNEAD